MSIRFIDAGLQTSVQDLGRTGMMRYGVSQGGAADPLAARLGNLLLGNPPHNPVLEVTLIGPRLEFQCDISLVVTGARFTLTLDGESVENDQVIQARRGSVLNFGQLRSGTRAYIAFAGQMALTRIFDSFSTHLQSGFGGCGGQPLKKGDLIRFEETRTVADRQLREEHRLRYTGHPRLRVVAGAEETLFSGETLERFYTQAFRVTPQSNRMGIRLTGEPLHCAARTQIISSGLCPGTIQVPPDGDPIIAFVEGQTIGGYPRIAHVISADQHLLGQLKANDRISFEKVSLARAHEILAGKSALLNQLTAEYSCHSASD
ncbi:5-oxoprolinase subunit C family protein [Microbulbifer thermotolerans]|uniref:5-oxoprolinase subunit C family protein n=1 Tax=Microbulbifer thermotolerans TaxID=252514 RepID=UPI00224901F8|nr:biotin-dependent carboxyltransferase family protein [Microbulbifer thermotolerans]MCX2832490.1 biotin-dependent carboxyltransferase family protein [Microbulbifer thermotolerans]